MHRLSLGAAIDDLLFLVEAAEPHDGNFQSLSPESTRERPGSVRQSLLLHSPTADIDLSQLSEDELLALNRRIIDRLRLLRSARQLVQLAQFSVGMMVEFTTDDGRTIQGRSRASIERRR